MNGYESLAQRLRRAGPLPIQQAVEFVVQATHAVAEAHNLGIIHRDLKPANLFVVRHRDRTESIKVLDFGISKLTEPTNRSMLETLTQTGTPPGSPPYMAPEQLQDCTQVDHRVDVWSLGITLFELVAGVRPFCGRTLTEICLSILGDPLPKLRRFRPDAPAGLETVVERCTAKNRDQRFVDVGAFSLALAPYGHDGTRHTADRAARMAEQSGEHAVRRMPPVDASVPTERLRAQSVPPPPPDSASARPLGSANAILASQVTHTAASDALTRTSLAPDAMPRRRRKAFALIVFVTATAAMGLAGVHALGRSKRRTPSEQVGMSHKALSGPAGHSERAGSLQQLSTGTLPTATTRARTNLVPATELMASKASHRDVTLAPMTTGEHDLGAARTPLVAAPPTRAPQTPATKPPLTQGEQRTRREKQESAFGSRR